MRLVGTVDMAEIMEMARQGLSKSEALERVRDRFKLDHARAQKIEVCASELHTGFDVYAG